MNGSPRNSTSRVPEVVFVILIVVLIICGALKQSKNQAAPRPKEEANKSTVVKLERMPIREIDIQRNLERGATHGEYIFAACVETEHQDTAIKLLLDIPYMNWDTPGDTWVLTSLKAEADQEPGTEWIQVTLPFTTTTDSPPNLNVFHLVIGGYIESELLVELRPKDELSLGILEKKWGEYVSPLPDFMPYMQN